MSTLMKVIPVLLYTGVVFSGMYLASLGKTGKQKLLAVLCFLAIVIFPSYSVAQQVLQGPIHIGTILGTMLTLIAYYFYKESSHKLFSLLIIALLTSLLVIGDPMSEIILVFPIVLVEAILLYKNRFVSRNQYFIMGTVLLGTLFALYVRHIWGEYIRVPMYGSMMFEDIPTTIKNGENALQLIFTLFHGDFFQRDVFSLKVVPVLLNAAAVILLGIGIWKWLKKKLFSLHTSQDALIAVLVLALVGNIFVYIYTNIADGTVLRYLLPVFVFGGIAAFSVLSYIKKPELYVGIVLFFILNAGLFAHMVYMSPVAIQPEKHVISFLQEKHLVKGIGEYWSATGITGQSNHEITIRQVLVDNNQIHPYFYLSNDSWFHYDNIKDSQFVIYRKGDGGFYSASVQSFGKPNHVYTVDDYVILTWNKPLFSHTTRGYRFYVISETGQLAL